VATRFFRFVIMHAFARQTTDGQTYRGTDGQKGLAIPCVALPAVTR